jgi:hypothetical protein
MSRFIDFYVSPRRRFFEGSLGNPIHDGVVPSRLADSVAIRVNGEPIEFIDESVPQLLHRTLLEMKQRGNVGINCRRFAALMYEPGIADDMPTYFRQPDYTAPVSPDDSTVNKPVTLGVIVNASLRSPDGFYDRHMAVPAHQPEQAAYLHKLGFLGPICLSGLQAAMDLYDCTHAYLPEGFATGQLAQLTNT